MNRRGYSKHLYDIDPPGMFRTLSDGRGIAHLEFMYPQARTAFCALIKSALADLPGLSNTSIDELLEQGGQHLLVPKEETTSYCY
ncbi:MAG: hypothetical protein RL213_1900, partial [Bacteroidota bacterium]